MIDGPPAGDPDETTAGEPTRPTRGAGRAALPVSVDGPAALEGSDGDGGRDDGPDDRRPQVLGYTVTDRLGEGGMGAVWRAVQRSTRREVALKVIGAAGLGSERVRHRFEREVELAAALDHPGIARVYEGGLDRGVCYYAMELVEGVPIDRYVARHRCDRNGILALMRLVCEAVQHAHQRGIIHRDLKPGNILVTAAGRPKVLDFGLAKAIHGGASSALSLDGQVAGTPAFMSPEQASGRLERTDTRSDVFSLGIILFRLLSGRPPYDASGSIIEVMRRIADQEPARLSDAGVASDAELESLLAKAMAKDPDRRYASAGALADDLGRYLAGDPLSARPPTFGYLFRKRARKHRAALVVAAGVLAALLVMAAWSYRRVALARDAAVAARLVAVRRGDEALSQKARAEENADRLRRSERNAKRLLAGSLINQGDALANLNRWEPARAAYHDARSVLVDLRAGGAAGADLARVDLADWDANRRCPPMLMSFAAGDGWREAIAFSPDGGLLAAGGSDSAVVVREAFTGRRLHAFDARSGYSHSAAFSPDGSLLLTGDDAGHVHVWSLAADGLRHTWKAHDQAVQSLAVSAAGDRVLSLGADGRLACWSLAGGERLWAADVPRQSHAATIQFFPGGDRALCGSDTCPPAVWDVVTGRRLYALGGVRSGAGIALSPDGKRVVGGDEQSVRVWDAATGEVLRVLSRQGFGVAPGAAVVRPDGRTALTGNTDRVLRAWDLEGGQLLSERGWVAGTRRAAFSPDGATVVSGLGSADSPMWGVDPGPEVRCLRGHLASVEAVAASADGRMVLSGSSDGTVRLWDAATGQSLGVVARDLTHVQAVAFLDDDRRALVASRLGVAVWDLLTNQKVRSFEGNWERLDRFALSPDRRLALSDAHGLTLWDAGTGAQLATPGGFAQDQPATSAPATSAPATSASGAGASPAAATSAIAFSADGHLAVTSAAGGGAVSLWDTRGGRRLRSWKVDALAYACAISPDGSRVAAGSYYGRTYLWAASGEGDPEVVRRDAPAGAVQALAFAPDGGLLVACHANGPVLFRDGSTLDTLRDVSGALRDPHRCALSGDGGLLAVGSRDGTVSLWDLSRTAAHRAWEPRLGAARRALAVNADDPSALAELARWYAFQQQPEPALTLAVRARAGGAEAGRLLAGRCAWQLGRRAEAAREFRAALDRHDAPDPYVRLCLRALGGE